MEHTIDKLKRYYQHRRGITVADSDTDFKGRLKPGAIMDHFQTSATAHAEMSGYGYEVMQSRNSAWVIVRMSIKMLKQPYIGDALSIFTLPEKPKMIDVNRGYYVFDEMGEAAILGSSKWCVLDINSFKVQRLAPLFEKNDFGEFVPYPPFEDANPKLANFAAGDAETSFQTFKVQLTDLDRNIHMNNARYGDIILNACGMAALEKQSISRLDINFVSQLFYDDEFAVQKIDSDGVTFIEARKITGGNMAADAVFRARVEWEQHTSCSR